MRRACWIVAVLATAVFTGWSGISPAQGAGGPVTIAGGATKIARWELYVSAPRPGRRCLGLRVEQLWDTTAIARRKRCGARRIAAGAVTLQTLASAGMGSFAYGRAGRGVSEVSVTVGDRAPVTATTLPSPLGGRDRFWVVQAGLGCAPVSVQALGATGQPGRKRRSGRIGPRGCG